MLDKAGDIHFTLMLWCSSEIVRRLDSQPHIGAAAESLLKTQRHLGRDGASPLHHVVQLLASNLRRFRRLGHALA